MKIFALTAVLLLALPLAASATETGLSAKALAKVLNSKSAQSVLKDRSIDKVQVEPIAATESSGYIISIVATEAGLSPAGPSTHPCMISITVIRPKAEPKAAYVITAQEVCAMSAPMRPPVQ